MKVNIRVHAVPKGGRIFSETKSEDSFAHTPLEAVPFVAVVADGHGDQEVNEATCAFSQFIATELCHRLTKSPQQTCEDLQQDVMERFTDCTSGAVTTRVVIDEDQLTVLYVGDCRLYRFTPNNSMVYEQLTEDHHPDHPGEYQRLFPLTIPQDLQSKFALFPWSDPFPKRLVTNGKNAHGKTTVRMLAVTRSFGDMDMRPLVISEPDVKTIEFDSHARHIFALCSDGGTDIVEQTFAAVRNQPDVLLDELHRLVQVNTPPKPGDDVTILLIELTPTSS